MGINNWKIARKILFGFLLVILIIGGAGGFLIYTLVDLAELQHAGAQRSFDLAEIKTIEVNVAGVYAIWGDAFIHRDLVTSRTDMAKVSSQAIRDIAAVQRLVDSDREREWAAEFEASYDTFLQLINSELIPMLDDLGELDPEAEDYAVRQEHLDKAIHARDEQADKARDETIQVLESIADALNQENIDSDVLYDRTYEQAIVVANIIFAVGLLAALVLALWLASTITRPIREVVAVANRLASGDLTMKFAASSRDETGQLMEAMANMVGTLRETVAEIQVSTGELSSASGQVSSTSQSLSQGTSEQAASVEETTTSLEQMNASITQNAENSREMERMAVKGADDVEESGRAVTETVEAMRSIAKKISIIEEIAYQTNLLALNAAIEAARAGEHGKGFAVVATEVRKLAERSQTAANQISELSGSSVTVAERSGVLLQELVPRIRRTVDLVQDVAAASAEQATGVSQINSALAQVDSVTQRNASAAEELSSTAEELSSQAQGIDQLMSHFRVEGESQRRRVRGNLPGVARPRVSEPAGMISQQPAEHLPEAQDYRRF